MPTSKITLYVVVVYRSKEDPSKYMMSTHTLAGSDLTKRMETIVTVEAKSWSDKWELVSFSHTFVPFEVRYQI